MSHYFRVAASGFFDPAQRRRIALRLTALCVGALVFLADSRVTRRGPEPRQAVATERRSQLESTLKKDKTASARQKAATALGDLGDSDALPTLIVAMLGDRDANVRAACAEALAALADPNAQPALRAATHDESPLVQKKAAVALNKLGGGSGGDKAAPLKGRVTVVVGRMGTKAKSGTLPDIPQRLREAVISEIRSSHEIDMIEDLGKSDSVRSGYTVDSSVTKLTRRTTPAGELEISCDVSMIIAVLPAKAVVGMVSGGASVIGPRGPSTKPTKAFIESLETDALNQAVKETHSSLMTFLRQQLRARLTN